MDRLRRLLLHNWWLKLLSLGLAYALWLGVADAPTAELRVAVPLELRNLSAGLMLASEVPDRVQVTLSGSERLLQALPYEELVVGVNLAGFAAGHHVYRFSPKDVGVPAGITMVYVQPADVQLDLLPREEQP